MEKNSRIKSEYPLTRVLLNLFEQKFKYSCIISKLRWHRSLKSSFLENLYWRQGPFYPTQSISWLPMFWRRKKPGCVCVCWCVGWGVTNVYCRNSISYENFKAHVQSFGLKCWQEMWLFLALYIFTISFWRACEPLVKQAPGQLWYWV